jgi:hypothetical protein
MRWLAQCAVPVLTIALVVACGCARSEPVTQGRTALLAGAAATGAQGADAAAQPVADPLLPPGVIRDSVKRFTDAAGLTDALSVILETVPDAAKGWKDQVQGATGRIEVHGELHEVLALLTSSREARDNLWHDLATWATPGALSSAMRIDKSEAIVEAAIADIAEGYYLFLAAAPRPTDPTEAIALMRRIARFEPPSELAGWQRTADPDYFDQQTIFDYIDGAAETHTRFGFARMSRGVYSLGDEKATIEVFDMGSSPDACGLYLALSRGSDKAYIGQASGTKGRLIRFWQGAYYCEVKAIARTGGLTQTVTALAAELALTLGPGGAPPLLLKKLAVLTSKACPESYFHQQKDQEDFFYLSTASALLLSPKTEGVGLKLDDSARPTTVLAVRYPSPEDAKKARQQLWSLIKVQGKEPEPGKPYEWDTGKFVSVSTDTDEPTDMVIAVFDATSADAAAQLLSRALECVR